MDGEKNRRMPVGLRFGKLRDGVLILSMRKVVEVSNGPLDNLIFYSYTNDFIKIYILVKSNTKTIII